MDSNFWVIGKPIMMIAFIGCMVECCFFIFAAVKLGAMARVYGTGDRAKKMDFRALNWAAVVGILVGIATAYIYTSHDPAAIVGWKSYLWVAIGSTSCGFITASAVTRILFIP